MIDRHVQHKMFRLASAAGLDSGFILESVIVAGWGIMYTWEKTKPSGERIMYRTIVAELSAERTRDLHTGLFEKCVREMAAIN